MMDNPKFKAALIGGGVFGVLAALPYIGALNALFCALFIGGGVLASYVFLKDHADAAQATFGDGAVVGLLAGLIGAVVTTVVDVVLTRLGLLGETGDLGEAVREMAEVGVELPEVVREILTSDSGASVLFGVQVVLNVLLFGVFATIGGLAGLAIFRKKDAN